ncbi:ribonuclease E inhibitor RraB [uncultured Sphingobacterium sp.]|uniref:ribonuclease E inhibitor RraB n=1 Tax=uncultured Sphingobacterium sp. TaxID=182688 RepID=UPI003748C8CF
MNKIPISFILLTFLVSCNQKNEKQNIDSSKVVDYNIVATAKSDNEIAVEELDAKAVKDLYKNGIVKDSKHKLEFFFYCPTQEQAKKLTTHLEYMNYTAGYRQPEGNKEFMVLGYTEPFPINERSIVEWAKSMSKVAEKYNSVFDGWQVAVK